jgi:Fe-S-cluster containining protein
MSDKSSCTCSSCVNACSYKPGWFMPEQIPDILAFFNVKSLDELLGAGMLAVDYFFDEGGKVGPLILSPNVVGNPNKAFPYDPRGRCVFLKDGLCEIHAAKPFECAQFVHIDSHEAVGVRHAEIVMAWRGRPELEPFRHTIAEVSVGDALDLALKNISQMREEA